MGCDTLPSNSTLLSITGMQASLAERQPASSASRERGDCFGRLPLPGNEQQVRADCVLQHRRKSPQRQGPRRARVAVQQRQLRRARLPRPAPQRDLGMTATQSGTQSCAPESRSPQAFPPGSRSVLAGPSLRASGPSPDPAASQARKTISVLRDTGDTGRARYHCFDESFARLPSRHQQPLLIVHAVVKLFHLHHARRRLRHPPHKHPLVGRSRRRLVRTRKALVHRREPRRE